MQTCQSDQEGARAILPCGRASIRGYCEGELCEAESIPWGSLLERSVVVIGKKDTEIPTPRLHAEEHKKLLKKSSE